MEKNKVSRRQFVTGLSAGAIVTVAASKVPVFGNVSGNSGKLAILGGDPVVKNKVWPKWPYVDDKVVDSVVKTTKSGAWCRIDAGNNTVRTFEQEYAKLMGAKFCVATGSGTQALSTCVEALGIGPGDEVITSPYTDMGTISSILTSRALPVLADLDPDSYQIDPKDVKRRITANTKALMPVHIMGQPCDIDSIMAIAKEKNLKVIEDACQAHFATHRGRTIGTIGNVGCFSFQSTKTIACGEGGGIIGNDEALMDQCYTVQNHGTSRKGRSETIGPKDRMNEFEGAILMGQLEGARARYELRNKNARYLTSKLKNFPGLVPQKLYEGTESGSFYLYPMSFHKEHWGGVTRDAFLKAVAAEGISLSPYIANGLHKEPWVDHILNLNVYKKMYSPARLKQYREQFHYPMADRVCAEMVMLWASGPLLGTQADMDDVINAIMKVYENRDKLAKI
jgi:dTDP-4-amino-4,6-dideoxygalactose transaminase